MDLMTTKQAAEYLKVTRGTVYKMIHRGDIRAYKIPSADIEPGEKRCTHYRIDRADLDKL